MFIGDCIDLQNLVDVDGQLWEYPTVGLVEDASSKAATAGSKFAPEKSWYLSFWLDNCMGGKIFLPNGSRISSAIEGFEI